MNILSFNLYMYLNKLVLYFPYLAEPPVQDVATWDGIQAGIMGLSAEKDRRWIFVPGRKLHEAQTHAKIYRVLHIVLTMFV